MKLPSLNTAIEELGGGEAVWLRGHAAQHRLVPALFRFPGGLEQERLFFAGSPLVSGTSEQRAAEYFDAMVTLHYSYVPTRLLAWTRSLGTVLRARS
jgi:hypothetical protein